MPLTSDAISELNRLIDIFFEKVGRKEKLSREILRLMEECVVYLYPKIKEWMENTREQIARGIQKKVLGKSAEITEIKKQTEPEILVDYVDWEMIEENGKSIIKPAYLNIMERSGNLSRAHARIEASFDVINPLSVKWAEKYSSELVTLVGKETKKGLREVVAQGLKEGKTFREIAKDINKMGIGLNERQSKALYKYKDLLEAQKLPKEVIENKFSKYYNRLQRERNELISSTEADRSVNEGYLDSLEGTGYEEVEISSAFDACEECLAMAGDKYTRDEARGLLPKHPRCRCHWIVVPEKRKKPKEPEKPGEPSDNLVSKYKDKIAEQEKLTKDMALYRKQLQNAYYLEKDPVATARYQKLFEEAASRRRKLMREVTMSMRKDLYVDKALRPDFKPSILFPDIETKVQIKVLKAIDECEKFVDKKVVGSYKVLIKKADSRAFYDMGEGVCLGKWDPYTSTDRLNGTVIHELGHFIENQNPEVHKAIMKFYNERTKGYPLEWLGEPFGQHEYTRKDKFIDAYMGKDYGGRATEILSMGLQNFYKNPYELATKDPEYFNFIYKIVRGML